DDAIEEDRLRERVELLRLVLDLQLPEELEIAGLLQVLFRDLCVVPDPRATLRIAAGRRPFRPAATLGGRRGRRERDRAGEHEPTSAGDCHRAASPMPKQYNMPSNVPM